MDGPIFDFHDYGEDVYIYIYAYIMIPLQKETMMKTLMTKKKMRMHCLMPLPLIQLEGGQPAELRAFAKVVMTMILFLA